MLTGVVGPLSEEDVPEQDEDEVMSISVSISGSTSAISPQPQLMRWLASDGTSKRRLPEVYRYTEGCDSRTSSSSWMTVGTSRAIACSFSVTRMGTREWTLTQVSVILEYSLSEETLVSGEDLKEAEASLGMMQRRAGRCMGRAISEASTRRWCVVEGDTFDGRWPR